MSEQGAPNSLVTPGWSHGAVNKVSLSGISATIGGGLAITPAQTSVPHATGTAACPPFGCGRICRGLDRVEAACRDFA